METAKKSQDDPYRSPAVVKRYAPEEQYYPEEWTASQDEFKRWVKKLPRVDEHNYLLSADVTVVLRALFEENKTLTRRLERVEDLNHRAGYRGSPPDPKDYKDD